MFRHCTVSAPSIAILCLVLLPASAGAQPGHEDLRRAVMEIVLEHPQQEIAVSVRDPEHMAFLDLKGATRFHAASTMKVAVMMAVFQQAEEGTLSLSDSLVVENRFTSILDGSEYAIEDDSDDVIYSRLGTRMSIRDLVYQMITVSSNLATNLLIQHVTADSAQALIDRLGNQQMKVLRGVEDIPAYRAGLNNQATSSDLALQLEALMKGAAVSQEADGEMVEILLDQRFNDMIPAGLPEDVKVAHKTGMITRIHHDAAIVYPPDAPPYVLVVLTGGFEDPDESAAVGARIARTVHGLLRP
ncbi:MAG: serine hydrolase [bacterium]